MSKNMGKITGYVTREYELKKNAYKYLIKTNKNEQDEYITFDGLRIMMHYNITAKYKKIPSKNPNYDDSKQIIEVKYNKIITDVSRIQKILLYEIDLSKKAIKKLIETYEENTMKKIMNEFETITKELKLETSDLEKIKLYVKADVMVKYTKFFDEFGVIYQPKWFDGLQKEYNGLIRN